MKRLILFTSTLVVIACNDNSGPGNEKLSCPPSIYVPHHEVDIETEDVLPEKIAIEIEDEVKYDECLEQAVIPPPPIVHGERRRTGLAVVVQHYGAYEHLPEDVSFKIYDRKDCNVDTLFFEVSNVSLDFQKVYPNGPKCGSNTVAKTKVTK